MFKKSNSVYLWAGFEGCHIWMKLRQHGKSCTYSSRSTTGYTICSYPCIFVCSKEFLALCKMHIYFCSLRAENNYVQCFCAFRNGKIPMHIFISGMYTTYMYLFAQTLQSFQDYSSRELRSIITQSWLNESNSKRQVLESNS